MLVLQAFAHAGSPPADIWSSSGYYPSVGLIAGSWLLPHSLRYPGAAADTGREFVAKLGYSRSRQDEILNSYSTGHLSTMAYGLYGAARWVRSAHTFGFALSSPDLWLSENEQRQRQQWSVRGALWYERTTGWFRGASLWADIASSSGTEPWHDPYGNESDEQTRAVDIELALSGLPVRWGALWFVRIGGRFAADELETSFDKRHLFDALDTVVVEQCCGLPPDTVLQNRDTVLSRNDGVATRDLYNPRFSAGFVFPPDRRHWLAVELGGAFCSRTLVDELDTVPLVRVSTPDSAHYPSGYYLEPAGTVDHTRSSTFHDTASVFLDVSARLRFGGKPVAAVVGMEGRAELSGFRSDGDPGFLDSPTWFWNTQSTRSIEMQAPILLSWTRNTVTVFGSWTPNVSWLSRARPVGTTYATQDTYRTTSLSLYRLALGLVYAPSSRVRISCIPELEDAVGSLRMELEATW